MAPIRLGDGTGIDSVRLGDGTAIEEITVDGQTVFSAVQVPDSGDLHARYDATELSFSDGQSVSTWNDQTGNGHDLTAGTPPTYISNGINGNPVVSFDGVNDFLDVAWSALSQPNHVFVVFQLQKTTGPSTFQAITDSANSSNRNVFSADDEFVMFAGSAINGTASDTNNHIGSALFDTTTSNLRIDGSQVASGNVGTQSLDGFRVGSAPNGTEFAEIYIGEILVYPQDKSGIENDVEIFLSNKWGITI